MKARDAISLVGKDASCDVSGTVVSGGMHLLEVLPLLLDSPQRRLSVSDGESILGVIDSDSLLEALARQIATRYDSSIIEVECTPADFSASLLARAVEDTDAHLVDMLTVPVDDGLMRVTLRVRSEDPSAAAQSLERYGYTVKDVFGHGDIDPMASMDRLLALQALINV